LEWNVGWGRHPASQKILGVINEKGAHAQVCDDLDLSFVACKFDLSSDDAPVYRKPSATELLKKTIKPVTDSQTALSAITAPIPPPAEVTSSTTLSPVEAWDTIDGRLNS
jgi:hypothetical protein